MLNKNVNVLFNYGYGANQFTIRCNFIVYGFELSGDVFEDLDFALMEDYQGSKTRLLVKIIFDKLNRTQTLSLIRYVMSASKKMTIDGYELEVVNNFKDGEFELLDGLNEYAKIELSFKARTLGVDGFLAAVEKGGKIGYLGHSLIGFSA